MFQHIKSQYYFICLILIGLSTPIFSQSINSLPKVVPSYSEDFRRYKSYPSMCFDNAFYGQNGELWLKTCGGAVQICNSGKETTADPS